MAGKKAKYSQRNSHHAMRVYHDCETVSYVDKDPQEMMAKNRKNKIFQEEESSWKDEDWGE